MYLITHRACSSGLKISIPSTNKQSGEIKIRRGTGKIPTENLADFVQSVANAENDPIWGKEALYERKENFIKKFEKTDGVQSRNKNSSFGTNLSLVHWVIPLITWTIVRFF